MMYIKNQRANTNLKYFYICIFYCVLLVFISSCAVSNYTQKGQLFWTEEFNTDSLNLNVWSKIPRPSNPSNWNRYMTNADSCYAFKNGRLMLYGIKNNNIELDTATYLTGGVYTMNKLSFGYGRIEIRAKLYPSKGAWPAIWMLPANLKWTDGGEIDIMERLNYDGIVYQTVHSNYTLVLNIKDNPKSAHTAPIKSGYNTYALERYPDSLVFYINKKHIFTYPRIQTDKADQFPFDKDDFYLLIDMQLGGGWVGEIDPSTLPAKMEIDWVHFYKFTDHK